MKVIGCKARWTQASRPLTPSRLYSPSYGGSNRVDNIILQGKDIVQISVVPICPGMTAGKRIDELSGDPHTIAKCANAAFQHELNAEFSPDALHVNVLASVLKGGIARYDEQRAKPRKFGYDILSDSVRQVFLFRVAAHVVKRQYGDRRFVG